MLPPLPSAFMNGTRIAAFRWTKHIYFYEPQPSITWVSQSSVTSICGAYSRGGEAVGYPPSTPFNDSGIVSLSLSSGPIILITVGL